VSAPVALATALLILPVELPDKTLMATLVPLRLSARRLELMEW